MSFTIALLNPKDPTEEGKLFTNIPCAPYDVPEHRMSYRMDPGPTNISTYSVVHLSNFDDIWHFEHISVLRNGVGMGALSKVLESLLMTGDSENEALREIGAMMFEWQYMYPSGLWAAA